MKRIVAIDTLRGFALLGILLMNIMSFSMPEVAYFNPTAYGGSDWVNRTAYNLVHVFVDQKFMAMFSILFGASMTLVLTNVEQKGGMAGRFHYTRNAWLFLIGLLHSLLLWDGDILLIYALCSFILFPLRKLTATWQFVLGLIIFMLPAVVYTIGSSILPTFEPSEIAALAAHWNPPDKALAAEIAHFRGDYTTQLIKRFAAAAPTGEALDLYFVSLIFEFFTRALGMMLVGMALYRWEVVTAKLSIQFYRRLLAIGLGVGVPLAVYGLVRNNSVGWDATYSMFTGRNLNLLATPFVASAYISLIILWSRTSLWANLQARLAAVGRMALTNYIAHSVIGTFIFYGFGLGLFGSVNRITQLLVVVGIWALQLWISPLWLRHFRYGPLEWVWRSLSYWQLQEIRRETSKGPRP